MNVKCTLFAGLLALLQFQIGSGVAQGFGGLGTEADGYSQPERGMIFSFPRDHGAHRDFRIEWWYLTGNLKAQDGREFGVQWTLFRSAITPPGKSNANSPSPWQSNQLWMGHAAVTGAGHHFVAETRARGGLGLAGARTAPFRAWINDWQMRAVPHSGNGSDNDNGSSNGSGNGINALALNAAGADFSYSLSLRANGPMVRHGDAGFSVKSSSGSASAYYSQPFYSVTGDLDLPEGKVAVTGTAWLDREWSSQPLDAKQKGWDWLSLNFDDGSKLMAFGLRQSDGLSYTSATAIASDGTTTAFGDGVVQMEPLEWTIVAGRSVPTRWHVRLSLPQPQPLPDKNIDVEVTALNPNAWMSTSIPYWEGPVLITGSKTGRGYLEMTGYQPTQP